MSIWKSQLTAVLREWSTTLLATITLMGNTLLISYEYVFLMMIINAFCDAT